MDHGDFRKQKYVHELRVAVALLALLGRGATAEADTVVAITAPSVGATVSGSVTVTTAVGSAVSWTDLYIDGNYWTSGPPFSNSWNSKTFTNGSHTISASAFGTNGAVIGSASVSVKVSNSSPTPTPTPSPTPSDPAYYVDSVHGSDSNNGRSPSSAWQTMSKVKQFISENVLVPGDQILFARGDSWTGGLTLPTGINGSSSNPIVFGNYGSGALPIIDGGSSAAACFYARGTGSGRTPLWSYITINGFECRNTTAYGVLFYQNQGGSAGMPGIVVKNMNIHNTGPGAYAGGGGGYDDDNYRNQLMFLDENHLADGVRFLNNKVDTCGGHNCIQVQFDTGSPQIIGNTCYGWVHNCIDVKQSRGVLVKNNVVHGPNPQGAAYYYENLVGPVTNGSITWQGNLAYNVPNGIECEGDSSLGRVSCRAYNNTLYLGNSSAIVSAATGGLSWDVRNNILDTTDPIYVCDSYNTNSCGEIKTWDYNDDGGSQGNPDSAVAGPHDIIGVNPVYVSETRANLHLQSGSPCINAGLPGLTSGNADMGAY